MWRSNKNWDHDIQLAAQTYNMQTTLVKRYPNMSIFKYIKNSISHSNIFYAILVWGHATSNRNVFAQQRTIRIILSLSYKSNCKEHFISLNILTVPYIYILQCLLHVKLNSNNFLTRSQLHTHNIR